MNIPLVTSRAEGRGLSGQGDEPGQSRRGSLATLKQRNFLFYAISRFAATGAMTLQQAVVAWQVYEISGSAFQLGLLGLVRFAPTLPLGLLGGAVADRFDRRRIVLISQVAPITSSAALLLATAGGSESLPLIYVLVFLMSIGVAFDYPARQALLPAVLRPETFHSGITVAATANSLGFVTGPAVGGLVIALAGVSTAYGAHLALLAVALVSLLLVRAQERDTVRRSVSLEGIKEGVRFVWRNQVLLGCMTLDLFAVVFGAVTALLPIYAEEILDVGPWGYGLLSAALEFGALLMALLLLWLPPIQRAGRALIYSIAFFGIGIIVFGFSRSFPLSLAAYMLVGMADQISVVMRQTIVQLVAPDELRGRVISVNQMFVGTANQMGAVRAGWLAAATSATFAAVSGGMACLVALGLVSAKLPKLGAYNTTSDVERQLAVPQQGSPPAETPVGAAKDRDPAGPPPSRRCA
ncbi:MAG: MFS transporter [Dehalococcoidia bacterium]|nr:MFS transporter [Dehalococcoidia bacterium]